MDVLPMSASAPSSYVQYVIMHCLEAETTPSSRSLTSLSKKHTLNAFYVYLHNKRHSKFASAVATALQLHQYSQT
jgi:hypothetical protein